MEEGIRNYLEREDMGMCKDLTFLRRGNFCAFKVWRVRWERPFMERS